MGEHSGFALAPGATKVGRQAFRSLMITKYGSVLGAWRVLDSLGRGRITFADFCRASPSFGGSYDVNSLFKMLDVNENGYLGIAELDPDLAVLLKDFADALTKACGSAEYAWRRRFATGVYGRCSAKMFEQGAASIGYDGDLVPLFVALDIDLCGVSFKEFTMLDKWFKEAKPIGRQAYQSALAATSASLGTSYSEPSIQRCRTAPA